MVWTVIKSQSRTHKQDIQKQLNIILLLKSILFVKFNMILCIKEYSNHMCIMSLFLNMQKSDLKNTHTPELALFSMCEKRFKAFHVEKRETLWATNEN